jgi:tetratricopeptide (TPR) repeat protein
VRCPNCDFTFESGHDRGGGNCPNCQFDLVLYAKTVQASNALYNQGLSKAQADDMTGAAECLRRSLELNKNNLTSRNLLGLVYFEIGRVGEAMLEWGVSASGRPEPDPAADYLKRVRENPRDLEKLDAAIRFYNQALTFVRQKNDDMALIQLKKAVETSPKFVDALNLLALCLLMQNDRERALATVEKTLAVDAGNPTALRYLSEINPAKGKAEMIRRGKKAAQTLTASSAATNVATNVATNLASSVAATVATTVAKTIQPGLMGLSREEKKGLRGAFPAAEIVAFIVGALCAFAVLYILIMPAQTSAAQKQIETLDNEKTALVEDLQDQLDGAREEIQRIDDGKKQQEVELNQLKAEIALRDKTAAVTDAQSKFDRKQYQEAVDAVTLMDEETLPSELAESVRAIREMSYPELVKQYYQTGMTNYNRGNWETAFAEMEKALRYIQPENTQSADVLYYLGRTAERLTDTETARKSYQRILDEYSGSQQIRNANTRLNLLG